MFSAVALLGVSTVAAQETLIEEIIVTAQKREQLAQDIPVAITAITSDALENTSAFSIEDLRDLVAGLEIVNAEPGSNRISSRGVTDIGGAFEATASVGYYLDETPVSSFATSMPEIALWDVERVEVLRGPQGTLFGEGSMAGTIRVIARKPDASAFSANVMGSASSTSKSDGDNYSVRTVLNVPLSDDKLAARLSVGYQDDSGWIDVPNDRGAKDTNDRQQLDARLALRWTPSDALTVDFSYMHQDVERGAPFTATRRGFKNPPEASPAQGPFRAAGPPR